MKRLESLDILRGMDMFMILCAGWSPLIFLCEALGSPAWGEPGCWWLLRQCHHAAWGAGVTIIDLIFPTFLFIAGVTFPYSLARQREKGMPGGAIAGKILRRVVLLFVLGLMYNHVLDFDWAHNAIWSVIGKIGVAWGVAAFIWFAGGRRAAVGGVAGLLVVWWLLCRFVTPPGVAEGTDTMAACANYIGRWVDANFLTVSHRHEGACAMIGMVPTALLGMLAGDFLRNARLSGRAHVCGLAAAGAALILLSLGWEALPWGVPRIKICWSSSYVLFAGGVSALALALVYWIVDVRGWRKWGFFFKVIGVNPLTIYLLSWTVLRWENEKAYFFGGLMRAFPGPVMNCIAEWGTVGLFWLLLYWMYRREIFLRV